MDIKNVVLAGVGGQGVVSTSMVLAAAALEEGFDVKQSEVHGMAQRGGAVTSHVRFGSGTVYSAIVAQHKADIVIGFEMLESLRAAPYLSTDGLLITSTESITNKIQIPDYPPFEELLAKVQAENHILVDSARLARKAGSVKTQSAVMLGAASPYLGIKDEVYQEFIQRTFSRKGERIVEANLNAMNLGKTAGEFYRALEQREIPRPFLYVLAKKLTFDETIGDAAEAWAGIAASPNAQGIGDALLAYEKDVPVGSEYAKRLLDASSDSSFDTAQLEELLQPK
jgi:indolepyruvate ferredoxin oxidoreductase beta subunit